MSSGDAIGAARIAAFRDWLADSALVPGGSGMVVPVPTPAQDHLERELVGFFTGEPGYYAAVKSRQVGWTTWLLLWSMWRASVDPSYCCIWVAPHDRIADEVLAKFRAISTASGISLARDNRDGCVVRGGGRIVWATIGGTEAIADVVGRAGTFTEAIFTEAAYPYESDLMWVAIDALRPALKRWRAPVMFDSTPNGKRGRGSAYHAVVQAILRREMAGAAALCGWWLEPSYVADVPAHGIGELSAEERRGQSEHGWTASQIQWRREEMRDPRARKKFAENYPESLDRCFIDAQTSQILDPSTIARYDAKHWPAPLTQPLPCAGPRDPIGEAFGRSFVRVYAKPVAGARYFAGLDCASGRAKDAQALVILDGAGHTVAVAQQWLEGPRLASVVVRLCSWFGADLLAEAQWSEHVVPYLSGGVHLSDPRLPAEELACLAGRWAWRLDIEATSGSSRGPIIGAALDVIEAGGLEDQALWTQAQALERDAKGRIAGGQGELDDLVLALGLAATLRVRWVARGARGATGERSKPRRNGVRNAPAARKVGASVRGYLGSDSRR